MIEKKVGILTWHYFLNFGSALQAYALKQTIEKLGYITEVINYRNPKDGLPNQYKDLIRLFISKIFFQRGVLFGHQITYPFLNFHKKYLKIKKPFNDIETLRNISKNFYSIICGSDQIWAPNILNPVYFLNFVPNNVRRISYAASIGLNNIPENLVNLYHSELKKFHSISVREKMGQILLENKCNIKSSIVLDPTLLLDEEEWSRMERKPFELNLNLDNEYVFCYFLKKDNKYKQAILDKFGENIIGYSLNLNDKSWMKDVTGYIGPREFLWLIHHAKTIITDSFHGTIFSLIFHKNFITFNRFKINDPICQNSRIEQLNDYFFIKNKIFNEDDLIFDNEYNYEYFDNNITKYKNNSINYLTYALK